MVRASLLVSALLVLACAKDPAPAVASAQAINPWETIDEAFKGCEGG
jgi:hypothetical protein